MNERVRTQFNTASSEYDANRRKLIPAFDVFYRAGVDFLAYAGDSPAALDIGAGTGIFTAQFLERYSNASVTLLDFSENMIELAREKFSENAKISCVLGDYATEDLGKARYDVVISALSLHHLDPEEKRAFFTKVHTALREGGEFVNADIIKRADPELNERFDALWTDFVRCNVGESEYFNRFLESRNVDDPSTAEEQLSWLIDCGFARSYSIFQYLNFAVMYAAK